MTDVRNYVFIDGSYLMLAYQSTMKKVFQEGVVDFNNFDLLGFRKHLGASKAFYYDAAPEGSPVDDPRIKLLMRINALEGFHVRRGFLNPQKPRGQKEVDVALAVDCLTHAFNKNFWHVTLVAGDRDFRPLVVSLVQSGIHVHVCYEPSSGNEALYGAADARIKMTLPFFWEHSLQSFKEANPLPQAERWHDTSHGLRIRTGRWQGGQVSLHRSEAPGQFALIAARPKPKRPLKLVFGDEQKLLNYFTAVHGEIQWDT